MGEEVQIHSFLISTLDGGGWSNSRPIYFSRKNTSTSCVGGLVGSRDNLDFWRREISLFLSPAGIRTSDSPSCSLVAVTSIFFFLYPAFTTLAGLSLIFQVSWSHTRSQSVGLLWTSDQPVAETSDNTYNRQTSMTPAGFELAFPVGDFSPHQNIHFDPEVRGRKSAGEYNRPLTLFYSRN